MENKPICRYCKYKRHAGFPHAVCSEGKRMNEVGDWLYEKCSYKNKDFKCLDFKPKWIHRRKYK